MPYEFRTKPFAHQLEEWTANHALQARGILWEQGTGKSKLTIDTACALYEAGEIGGVVVIAPNGVHRNWVENEIPDHAPERLQPKIRAHYYQSAKATTKWHQNAVASIINWNGFAWLTMSYDAFTTDKAKAALLAFFNKHDKRILYVLDESQVIKNPDAEVTKSVLRSARFGNYRRILTGTPIAQGPFDIYSQVKFLDDKFWERRGLGSFTDFKAHHAYFKKGWNPHAIARDENGKPRRDARGQKVFGAEYDVPDKDQGDDGYRNLEELNEALRTICSRVTKDVVLDLPPKLYTKRYFTMSPEQARIYRDLRDEYMVWLGEGGPEAEAEQLGIPGISSCNDCGGKREINVEGFIYPCPTCGQAQVFNPDEAKQLVVANLAMVRLLRLQQVTCGYLPTDDEDEPLYTIPGANRRLDLACDYIQDFGHKMIVWARFKLDIDLILEELKRRGIEAVRYDGQVGDDERAEAKARFQGERTRYAGTQVVGRDPIPEKLQAQVFVGNQAAGATGLTLTKARGVGYYSNDYRLINRLQSEDRAHRIGQLNPVTYVDFMAEDTVDVKIVDALRSKFNIASKINGDTMKEWL